jgi:sulfite reductase (NADPH) hemoprotein beta-component
VPKNEVANTLDRILWVYLERRQDGERFLDTFRRIGLEPFRVRAYAPGSQEAKQEEERYAVGY